MQDDVLRRVFRWVFAAFLVAAGANHFIDPRFYVAIVPPMLPAPLAIVYVSGVVESALGIWLLTPWRRNAARWASIAMLIAVFPANLYHALSGGLTHADLPDMMSNATLAWLRLPLQFALIAWVYWSAKPPAARPSSSATS